MITVKSDGLWPELQKLFKKSNNIKAAVAYVSDDSSISFGKGDILVVDASDVSIAGGRTSGSVLKSSYKKGAKLYSCDTLHGKVIVFDHHAYIGSANISKNSMEHLDEIGIISDHPNVLSGAIQLIDDLVSQSDEIDSNFIDMISKIDVIRSPSPSIAKRRKVEIGALRTWLVSLRNDADYPGDEKKVEGDSALVEIAKGEEAAWFWMRKGTRFCTEAKIGDSVVIIERANKESKKPESAYRHVPIKHITEDKTANTKAYHYAYTKDHIVRWKRFKEFAENASISRLGSGLNTIRVLSEKQSNVLFEIWET